MPRKKTLQSNFSSGEIAPDIGMRQDTEQYQNGAKSLLNRRVMIGGGTKRRPGSWRDADLAAPSRVEDFIVNQTTKYVLAFSDGFVQAYVVDLTTGKTTAAGSVSSTKWTGSIWQEMNYSQSADTAFLTHPDMPTQVLTRTSANTWTAANFTFYADGPRTAQPYYKVADRTMTLQPSALTGTITLTVSGSTAWFVSAHVGQIIRYLKRECLITAVAANGLSCTATVTETLPGTYSLTVTSSANFTVGESTEGATSGAKGVVSEIADGTHMTIYLLDVKQTTSTTDTVHFFTRTSTMQAFANETIIGPRATTAITGSSAATPAAVTDWDEQLIGPVYGYPSCSTLHRNRMLFAGHPAIPNGLIGSRVDNIYSFDIGDQSDGDGIFEFLGDAGASEIVQLHSAANLLTLTDHGPYYTPESVTSPFRPSSISFVSFGSTWPITATAKSHNFDDGVVFVSGSLVIKARQTGNVATQQWDASEVSLLAHHLIDTPTNMAVVTNFADGPERYCVLRNTDGTAAVMQLVEGQKIRNFTPWTVDGSIQSVCGVGKFLYAAVTRSIAGGTLYLLERFDQDITLDCATEYATEAAMAAAGTGVVARYGGTDVNVVTGTSHLGTYPPSLTNVPAGPYVVGIYYDSELELLPPVIEGPEGPAAGDYMRIVECFAYVESSQRFAADGYTLSAYQVTDPIDQPPPNKDGPQRFTFLGWERQPTILFNQPDPLPLDILAVRSTVAF